MDTWNTVYLSPLLFGIVGYLLRLLCGLLLFYALRTCQSLHKREEFEQAGFDVSVSWWWGQEHDSASSCQSSAGCAASVEGMTGTTRCCSLASHLYFYQNSEASLLSDMLTALLFRLIKLATVLIFQTNQQLGHLPKLCLTETLVFFLPCFTYAVAIYP